MGPLGPTDAMRSRQPSNGPDRLRDVLRAGPPRSQERPRMAARPSDNLQRRSTAPFVFRACTKYKPRTLGGCQESSSNTRLGSAPPSAAVTSVVSELVCRAHVTRIVSEQAPRNESGAREKTTTVTLDISHGCSRSRYHRIMTSAITAFVARRWLVPESRVSVDVQPLQGGLESAVARACISIDDDTFGVPPQVVVKQLFGDLAREADVYETLWQHLVRPPAGRMFGRDVSDDATYLYLEDVASFSPWPWPDTMTAARVCRALATLHDSRGLPRDPFAWNYEDQLTRSAEKTLALAALARDASGEKVWRRLGDLRRVVGTLPVIRHRLLADGGTVIHGDMHPGNVIVRTADGDLDVVLIDWARARIGSPLEDIASWLHSLGCWEPQARRRHDTLLRAYLESRQVPRRFDAALRVDYWFASVSNGLSGAIRYHIAVLANSAEAEAARASSRLALKAWERVVRRAAALLNTNLDR